MRIGLLISLLTFIVITWGCKHDPIIPDDYIIIDTTTNPIDTITNPIDTTNMGIPCDSNIVYFKWDVLPILASSCGIPGCHDAATAEEGIILIDYASVIASNIIEAGKPGNSDMYEAITDTDPDKKMPPPASGITLSQDQINTIFEWINQGAKNLDCNPNYGSCDTSGMSFSSNIWPILQNYCAGCHSGANPNGGISLDGYAAIQAQAINGKLFAVVNHEAGVFPMPYNQSKLDECTVSKIKSWIDAGAPNN